MFGDMNSFDDTDAFDGVPLSQRAMAARPAPYLDGLNDEQRAAVMQQIGRASCRERV